MRKEPMSACDVAPVRLIVNIKRMIDSHCTWRAERARVRVQLRRKARIDVPDAMRKPKVGSFWRVCINGSNTTSKAHQLTGLRRPGSTEIEDGYSRIRLPRSNVSEARNAVSFRLY